MKKYHTLLVREAVHLPWSIHFGDYDRQVVQDEREDIRDEYPHILIIASDADQKSIDAAVRETNWNTFRTLCGPRPMGRGAQAHWELQWERFLKSDLLAEEVGR